MPWYRRNYVAGGTYFFTVVTHRRQKFLTGEVARTCMRNAITKVQRRSPFELDAIVLLPDHFHAVITLPTGDDKYSSRMRRIKQEFTRTFLIASKSTVASRFSRAARRERSVWQHRFWEHTCRDEDDMKGCIDYIHFNPVKHGYVQRVRDYPWSTFARYVSMGEYDIDWGVNEFLVWSPPDAWD